MDRAKIKRPHQSQSLNKPEGTGGVVNRNRVQSLYVTGTRHKQLHDMHVHPKQVRCSHKHKLHFIIPVYVIENWKLSLFAREVPFSATDFRRDSHPSPPCCPSSSCSRPPATPTACTEALYYCHITRWRHQQDHIKKIGEWSTSFTNYQKCLGLKLY